mgnify:CR=1|tara:strand:+ start:69 stop:230 length:162 start_codon:yes stop_codon:yes gene_type:complete
MKYWYILFFSLAFLFSSEPIKADGHGEKKEVAEETIEETSEEKKEQTTEEKKE